MGKHIWIINEYAGSPYHGMEFRSYYLAKEWVRMGYRVTIISSSYSHVFKNQPTKKYEKIDGVDFVWIPTLNYGTSNDKRRVLKWFIFSAKIFFLPFMVKKPDIVLVSPMPPFPILAGFLFAKYYKAKLIYEVKDIWPLSVVELGGFKPTHPFIRFMGWFEKLALTKSDEIVSNLQNYTQHIKNIGIDRESHWISNGVDFDELQKVEPLDENVASQIPKDKFIVGYTGAIGRANALESFLQSAVYLEKYQEILLVIVGDGPQKKELQERYKNSLNILFVDPIPKIQVQSILHLFNGCYIGLKKEKLFQYGVSPNKLYDYMYSAKPIVYAIDSGENNLVKTALCGIVVNAEDVIDISKGIEKLYQMDKEKQKIMGENGKDYVLKHFNYEKLAKEFAQLL
jgi:glycosyltransferase involved in cell wall biosynthesis